MKHLVYILFLLTVSFSACRQHSVYPSVMQQAEALMNTRPDSALHLLQGMADTLAMLPEEARMYHSLLTIQAKDKLYITHTSDSLINRTVSFYESYGDNDRLMMAYFYQGSTYRDMNDAPRALKAFQQAVDLNVPNYDLLAKTYNQMGTLFMYQGLHDEVIRVNRKSIEAYLSLGKRNKISYAQRDIARMYDIKNMPDSALHYYKEACNTALMDGDSVRYYGILSELGGYYYGIKEMDKAKQILLLCKGLDCIHNKTHIYTILGHVYRNEHQEDSANFYYLKAAANGNIYQKYNNYRHSFMMSNNEGNYAEAVNYIKKALALKDSIDKITQTETITKINSLYNYQPTENQNTRLVLEKEKLKNWILVVLMLSISLLSISGGIIFYQKRKKEQTLYRAEERRKQEEEKYRLSQAAVRDNEQKIKELDYLLENAKKENNQLQQKLVEAQQQKLKAYNEVIHQWNKEQKMRLIAFKQSDIYQEILLAAKDDKLNMTPLQQPGKWAVIQEHIDSIYPEFTERLHKLCPSLSDTDIQVCYLAKIGVTPSGISRILKLTRQAITNIRKRIIKKTGVAAGEASNFDHFIEEF